jgi:serine/threonine protein kinase
MRHSHSFHLFLILPFLTLFVTTVSLFCPSPFLPIHPTFGLLALPFLFTLPSHYILSRLLLCLPAGNFEFRNHIALVFEFQAMNLRETLYKFGKDVGINIGAVRMYARQLLSALRHLADLKIVHGDIKLDNILCSEDLKQVTLCDFGSAFLETDKDIKPTPYIVSRFYRAPEIILGLTCKNAVTPLLSIVPITQVPPFFILTNTHSY